MANYKLVDADQLDADLTTVADAIRAKTGGTEQLSFPEGMAGGVGAAYEAGKQAEYDAFWDAIQASGTRENYARAFAHWQCEYLRPKYKVALSASASYSYEVFRNNYILKKVESAYFDFSNEPLGNRKDTVQFALFYWCSGLEEVEDIGLRASYYYSTTFLQCKKLKTIAILRSADYTVYESAFDACAALENITIEGTIGQNGFDVHWSTPLSKASILSIINALSTTTTDLTVTLSLTAVNNAFETSEGAADGSASEEWLTLVATKSNWTIALADA